jgi:hypothetical protein
MQATEVTFGNVHRTRNGPMLINRKMDKPREVHISTQDTATHGWVKKGKSHIASDLCEAKNQPTCCYHTNRKLINYF